MAAIPADLPKTGKRSAYIEETVKATRELNTRETKLPVGRPSTFSTELAENICLQITQGKSLYSICRQDGMPDMSTVYDWIRKFPDFANRYSQARQDQADTLADEIMRISDELEHATDPIQVQAARVRVEARRWIAARLKPSKWGDKVTTEISGPDGSPLPLVTVQFVSPGQKQVEGEVIDQ